VTVSKQAKAAEFGLSVHVPVFPEGTGGVLSRVTASAVNGGR
jgi:hypothetical protein